jgi:hypothetical protein
VELTSQVANLEDEIKLLKGEIKAILKEIRAAVLSRDNPFDPASSARSTSAAAPVIVEPAASVVPQTSEPAPPMATPFAPGQPAAAPPVHQEPIEFPRAASEPTPAPKGHESLPLHASKPAAEDRTEQPPSLLTIASLLGWADDAITTLGPRRFRLMLELAYFAELLSPEVRDVLRELADLSPSTDDVAGPMNTNECLLQLHQLEAVISGERVTRLPRRRHKRRGGNAG